MFGSSARNSDPAGIITIAPRIQLTAGTLPSRLNLSPIRRECSAAQDLARARLKQFVQGRSMVIESERALAKSRPSVRRGVCSGSWPCKNTARVTSGHRAQPWTASAPPPKAGLALAAPQIGHHGFTRALLAAHQRHDPAPAEQREDRRGVDHGADDDESQKRGFVAQRRHAGEIRSRKARRQP